MLYVTTIDRPRETGRILVVEDNLSTVKVLRELLEGDGYEVDVASTLADGLRKIRCVDLTMLDVVLPDGNALDLCRLVRATPDLARHPIILLSGRGSATDRARGLKAGADDYLAKPFDSEELLVRVRTLFHTRRVESDLRQHTRQLSALRHLTTILVNTVEVADLAQRIVNAVPEVFGADSAFLGGVLCSVDSVSRSMRVHAMTDTPLTREAAKLLDYPLQEYQASFDPPVNLLQRVAAEGTAQESAHLADFIAPTVPRPVASEIEGLVGMRGGMAMPVRAQGKLVGAFFFILKKPVSEITTLERELMRDFVDTIGIALENVRLYVEAAQLMVTDGLTGVANRRRFDQALDEEIRRARGLGYPVGLLLIDVDHFKRFNDRFGHQIGDRILQAVAQTLSASVRQTDLVARYGGEEFTVILPGTPLSGLTPIGEKLRQAVRALRLDGVPDIPEVTLSIGATSAAPPQLSADALIRCADSAMYLAKNTHDSVRVVDPLAAGERLDAEAVEVPFGRRATD